MAKFLLACLLLNLVFLPACGGNQSETARRLGTSRVTLIDKMKKYGLAKKAE